MKKRLVPGLFSSISDAELMIAAMNDEAENGAQSVSSENGSPQSILENAYNSAQNQTE